MNWTADQRQDVANHLLGSWPGTITQWGKEAFASYLTVLQARGLTPEQVITAVLTWTGDSNFPPSAPSLAAAAATDPSAPSFAEMLELVFGPNGVLAARTTVRKGSWEFGERAALDLEAMRDRTEMVHPLVQAFIRAQRLENLRTLNLDDEEHGGARRHTLAQEWDEHVQKMRGRDVAALTAQRGSGSLSSFNPLDALHVARPVVELAGGER